MRKTMPEQLLRLTTRVQMHRMLIFHVLRAGERFSTLIFSPYNEQHRRTVRFHHSKRYKCPIYQLTLAIFLRAVSFPVHHRIL